MLLKQFTNISFTLSLDGYNQVNRYIRWPSDWATIKSNIEKIKSMTTKVFVNVTVSVYNITKLNDLVMFLETVLPNHIIMLSQAKNHPGLSPFNFPNKELAIEQLELLKLTDSYSTQPIFTEKVDYFINMIKKYPVSIPDLAEFFKYNDALDASRGIKLADYIPELEECRKLITKQISNTNAE
jgi:sulfatase maturation enzyme AslB (radical SAM superfamily)